MIKHFFNTIEKCILDQIINFRYAFFFFKLL